jgi:hypothetical protein
MTDRANLIETLLVDPSKASQVTREEAGALAVELARVAKALELRAVRGEEVKAEPKLLTLAEVAVRSRKSLRWWRERWRAEFAGVAIKKGRTPLIPEDAVERWLGRDCDRA